MDIVLSPRKMLFIGILYVERAIGFLVFLDIAETLMITRFQALKKVMLIMKLKKQKTRKRKDMKSMRVFLVKLKVLH